MEMRVKVYNSQFVNEYSPGDIVYYKGARFVCSHSELCQDASYPIDFYSSGDKSVWSGIPSEYAVSKGADTYHQGTAYADGDIITLYGTKFKCLNSENCSSSEVIHHPLAFNSNKDTWEHLDEHEENEENEENSYYQMRIFSRFCVYPELDDIEIPSDWNNLVEVTMSKEKTSTLLDGLEFQNVLIMNFKNIVLMLLMK